MELRNDTEVSRLPQPPSRCPLKSPHSPSPRSIDHVIAYNQVGLREREVIFQDAILLEPPRLASHGIDSLQAAIGNIEVIISEQRTMIHDLEDYIVQRR